MSHVPDHSDLWTEQQKMMKSQETNIIHVKQETCHQSIQVGLGLEQQESLVIAVSNELLGIAIARTFVHPAALELVKAVDNDLQQLQTGDESLVIGS